MLETAWAYAFIAGCLTMQARQSATGVPPSAWRSAYLIRSSVNRLPFMVLAPDLGGRQKPIESASKPSGNRGQGHFEGTASSGPSDGRPAVDSLAKRPAPARRAPASGRIPSGNPVGYCSGAVRSTRTGILAMLAGSTMQAKITIGSPR